MDQEIQYFNSLEAAQILGVNVSSIKRWTDQGKLACVRTAGGHRKFLFKHLSDFLARHQKKMSKAHLFPIENEADLALSYQIMQGDFERLSAAVLQNALRGERHAIQKILNGLYMGQYAPHQIYDEVVTPVLHRIGTLWEEQQISVIEEHFATQAIRDAIIRLQGIVMLPPGNQQVAVCRSLSTELHDIALKLVDHLLEYRGFRVLYSGQITPTVDLEHIFSSFRPNRVYLSSTVIEDQAAAQAEYYQICHYCQSFEAQLFVGGQGFQQLQIEHPALGGQLESFAAVMAS